MHEQDILNVNIFTFVFSACIHAFVSVQTCVSKLGVERNKLQPEAFSVFKYGGSAQISELHSPSE